MKIIEKVGIFVIRRQRGMRAELLLFTHVDYPDASIQIPGGSIEPGELPFVAALRELHEESGVESLSLIRPRYFRSAVKRYIGSNDPSALLSV